MEWLRNNSIIRNNRQIRSSQQVQAEADCDPTACYDSFKQHWQQIYRIFARNQQMPKQDDVLSVVNHLEQMASLLRYDMRKFEQHTIPVTTMSQCLEYLIAENILHQLYEWGLRAGMYCNVIRTEQLKFYEMLISQSRYMLIVREPFLRPLLKLLQSCSGAVFAKQKDTEKGLVVVLFHICALLMQNVDLVDLFLVHEQNLTKFVIFELLVQYMHRDDAIGMQARDALLLCLSLSRRHSAITTYLRDHSNICLLLATGLGGLYSVLPRSLQDAAAPDWHRLTPDDVDDLHDLAAFATALEFANLVAKVTHRMISGHLHEYVYRGFLIPVLGPALLQPDVAEQIAATAYLELMLRTVSAPGLLQPLLRFILQVEYDSQRLLPVMMYRIRHPSSQQLCLVSLALFQTLIDLHCEDVMLELVFLHLQPCVHLMFSQRRTFLPLDPHSESFEQFLVLAPDCCSFGCDDNMSSLRASGGALLEGRAVHWNHYGSQRSLYGNYHAYLCDARNKIDACQVACEQWTNAYMGVENTINGKEQDNISSGRSQWESIGYESLKIRPDLSELPEWKLSRSVTTSPMLSSSSTAVDSGGESLITSSTNGHDLNSKPKTDCIDFDCGSSGPLLAITLGKLKDMLSTSIYVNIHVTGIISKLAVYPHPLLRSYLLDHSLVLQPNVPSLFQIIGGLKQRIDSFLTARTDRDLLLHQARTFFVDRETRLVNARRSAQDQKSGGGGADSHESTASTATTVFQRNSPKRRSITQSLNSLSVAMFGKRLGGENMMQMITAGPAQASGMDPSSTMTKPSSVLYPKFNEAQHVALCAVLLDEWVKELAALAQEHTIAQLANLLK